MNYEGQICRAPMERASFMLPVMVGCSYNKCRFCMLFKHLTYRILPLEQVEKELMRVKQARGKPKTIFLGDGNAFDLPTSRLLEILEMIHRYFPECRAIHADATVSGILRKSEEELEALQRAGMRHLYLGIESGLEDVLAFMEKDHTIEDAYEAISRMKEAGLIYDAHIMAGVSGAGRGSENARELARFLNETKPERVINFSMFLHRDAPLYKEIEKGRYTPATELENLKEERMLLELLDVDGLVYDGFHDYIEFRVRGVLPEDKKKMLSRLDGRIAECTETENVIAYI